MNDYRDNPECMQLLYAFRKSEYYLLDPVRRNVKTMRTNGLIPLYGVVSTVPMFEDFDYIPSFDLEELFNPYRDTYTPDRICYLNLSDKLTEEQKADVVAKMHQLANNCAAKKNIFYDIIIAAYRLLILDSIPKREDVSNEFCDEMSRFMEKGGAGNVSSGEWDDVTKHIKKGKGLIYEDDPIPLELHNKGKILLPDSELSYYKYYKELLEVLIPDEMKEKNRDKITTEKIDYIQQILGF